MFLNIGIISGVHGNEHMGNLVAMEIRKYFNDNKDKYKDIANIEFLMFTNIPGGLKNQRNCEDETTKDLNRWRNPLVPTCEEIRNKLDDFTKDMDLVIDIHNSPNCANIFLGHYNVHYGVELAALKSAGLEDKFVIWPQKSYTNARKGKNGFTYELKGMYQHSEFMKYVDEAKNDIIRFIISFINLNKDNKDEFTSVKYNQDDYVLKNYYSPVTGIMIFDNTSKVRYNKGDRIGVLYNFEGEVIDKVYAPCNLYLADYGNMYVSLNDILFMYKELK